MGSLGGILGVSGEARRGPSKTQADIEPRLMVLQRILGCRYGAGQT